VSYGNQLNIFKAKAHRYGADWRAIVLCADTYELKLAQEDAVNFTNGRLFRGMNLMKMANGAILRFRAVSDLRGTETAFNGNWFTQIVWLHMPTDRAMCDYARSRLRSREVPAEDWRYEYVKV
jgi:hypothetical protein